MGQKLRCLDRQSTKRRCSIC